MRLGGREAASTDFIEALNIGEATGLKQAFAEFGGRYTMQQIENHQKVSTFARELSRTLRQPPTVMKAPLTKRERQMLAALGGGNSDKSIGRDLGITEHGVRFHLKNLYAKLGGHDRAAAAVKSNLLT